MRPFRKPPPPPPDETRTLSDQEVVAKLLLGAANEKAEASALLQRIVENGYTSIVVQTPSGGMSVYTPRDGVQDAWLRVLICLQYFLGLDREKPEAKAEGEWKGDEKPKGGTGYA